MSHIDYYYGSGWDVEDEECEIAELLADEYEVVYCRNDNLGVLSYSSDEKGSEDEANAERPRCPHTKPGERRLRWTHLLTRHPANCCDKCCPEQDLKNVDSSICLVAVMVIIFSYFCIPEELLRQLSRV